MQGLKVYDELQGAQASAFIAVKGQLAVVLDQEKVELKDPTTLINVGEIRQLAARIQPGMMSAPCISCMNF